MLALASVILAIACGPPPGPVSSATQGAAGSGSSGPPMRTVSPYAAMAFLEAEMALEAGDAKAAVQSLTMALTSEPDDLLIKVRLAEALCASGHPDRAFEIIGEVLATDPGFDAALIALGDLHLAGGAIGEAEAAYRNAIQAEPSTWEAWTRLVDLYRGVGDREAALGAALDLLELDPYDEDGLLAAAELSLELGRTEDAFHFMSEYIRMVPVEPATTDRYGAVLALASKLLEQGETSRSIFLYTTYLGMFPGNLQATQGLVLALVASGDSIRARSLVDSVPGAGPDEPATLRLLNADLYLAAGAPAKAIEALEEAFGALEPSLPATVKLVWVEAIASTMRFDEATGALSSFGDTEEPARTQASSAIAVSMVRAWLFDEAWALVSSPGSDLRAHLSSRDLRTALRVLLLRSADAQLTAQVRKALMASPEGRLVLAEVDFLGSAQPDPEALLDALAGVREETQAGDVLVDAWSLEAVCVIEDVCKAKPTKVLSLTAKMAEVSPADPRLPALRGMFYLATGNRERALLSLEKANRTTPLDPLVKVWLARILAGVDEPRARALLDSALLLAPPPYVLAAIVGTG